MARGWRSRQATGTDRADRRRRRHQLRPRTPAARDVAGQLRGIRYLVTLDVGNRLHPKAARRLVATIAHPDNAAVIDPVSGIVVGGYGFVRPTPVPAKPETLFEWALNPPPMSLDVLPPAQAAFGRASYLTVSAGLGMLGGLPAQAAFGRDSFLGQGIIDIATYRAVLAGWMPPDQVLSHDKLEGMHGRTAALADARVTEAHIGDYLLFRARAHRWIRGGRARPVDARGAADVRAPGGTPAVHAAGGGGADAAGRRGGT